ncbi:unnamed protein product [Cylindrotheca closterium]|uniref:RING-type domain-containing protein n=1 Tax=Cylindrotheca closterium TaxID=2856 RepID=A0AAD2FZJ2_9STRA|nr:unnamed protein product [Cylindrotheca closterium]
MTGSPSAASNIISKQPTSVPSSVPTRMTAAATILPTAEAPSTNGASPPTPVPRQGTYSKPYKGKKRGPSNSNQMSNSSKIQVFLLSAAIFLALFLLNRGYNHSNAQQERNQQIQQEQEEQMQDRQQEEQMQDRRKQLLMEKFHFTTIDEQQQQQQQQQQQDGSSSSFFSSDKSSKNANNNNEEESEAKINDANDYDKVERLDDIEASCDSSNQLASSTTEQKASNESAENNKDDAYSSTDRSILERIEDSADHYCESTDQDVKNQNVQVEGEGHGNIANHHCMESNTATTASFFGGLWTQQQEPSHTTSTTTTATNNDNNNNSCSNNNECSICLDTYQSGDTICVSKKQACQHVFHHECIEEWLKKRDHCPLCRVNLMSNSSSS